MQISIFVSEEIGDSIYAKDPLSDFKGKKLNNIIKSFNSKLKKEIGKIQISEFAKDKEKDQTIHITIPRIDANNPCRWPTLIHEMAHNVMDNDFFTESDIEKDFETSLNEEQINFLHEFKQKINLKSWLTECWCDLFACVVFGPAFWFSQYVSFIFQGIRDNGPIDMDYPKALFRLNLIYKILSHRFSDTLFTELKETIALSESIFEYFDKLDNKGFNNDDDVRELFLYFREYFLEYFFIVEGSQLKLGTNNLNKNLKHLIKYTEGIEENTIKSLVGSLKEGFPIPSKKMDNNRIIEKPTYVQEILLAAWIYRNIDFKEVVLNRLNELTKYLQNRSEKEFVEQYEKLVVKPFIRFDQSILRSIQVSEWFDLYDPNNSPKISKQFENEFEKIGKNKDSFKNQLVDMEIYNLLKSGKLKIVPVMNLNEQLGSTSIDIRFGTSVQLYYPTKYGLIDLSDEQSLYSAEYNSKMIDLDYLESIIISPGQFILGHSMEYFKLPEKISGELEGRSSFARLGLEIHMTAGFIDPGFEGVLTFEMYNSGPNPIKLYPGIRIAQLRFIPINKPFRPYNKKHDAKYKGLLSHYTSMQSKDYEIERIKEEIKKYERIENNNRFYNFTY